MAKLPPGSAYFGLDRPENALPEDDPGVPPDLGAMPPPPPPGVMGAPPGEPSLGQSMEGGYEEDPEIIAMMAQQYMGIPREQIDSMPPDQYMQLLDQLEEGYPDDQRLIGAISRLRPRLLHENPAESAMPIAPEAPLGGPGGVAPAPPPAGPSFRPDQPY